MYIYIFSLDAIKQHKEIGHLNRFVLQEIQKRYILDINTKFLLYLSKKDISDISNIKLSFSEATNSQSSNGSRFDSFRYMWPYANMSGLK